MRVTNNLRSGDPGITEANFAKGSEVPDVNVNVNVSGKNKALGGCEVRRIPIANTDSAIAPSSSTTTTSLFGPNGYSGGVVTALGIGIGPNNGTLKTTSTSASCTSTSPISHSAFALEGAGEYVTINNTNTKCSNSSGSCSCSAPATATPTTTTSLGPVFRTENGKDISRVGVYNGIFLVDGLGHGVRVERQAQMMATTTTVAEGENYEYGLPDHNATTGFGLRDRQFYPTMPQLYNDQNPVCIRIDAGTCVSPMVHSNPDTSRFCVGVTCPSQNYFSGQSQDPESAAVIPVVPRTSTAVMPKPLNRNSVTLPVPSPPPHTPGNFCSGSVPLSGLNVAGIALGIASEGRTPAPNITCTGTTNPKSHNTGNLTERTLISTEAQTEDLPALTTLPPPPPSRNREQRKRERRERRRADRSQSQNQNYHPHHLLGNRNPVPGPSSRMLTLGGHRSSSEPGGDNNNVIYANTTTLCADQQHQRSDQSHAAAGGRNSQSLCESSPGNNCQGQLGLPDLLNSHLPPPYSTLPQTCERRLVLGNVPLHPPVMAQGQVQCHPHPHSHPPPLQMHGIPLQGFGSPPMIQTPQPILVSGSPPSGVCLASPAQPVRYHFAPTARASRRSLRTPRGVPYASEEEPKSCCGMSTSQAVSIRWFIIVIAVIGICCTVAGTALGATRSAGSQHLTLSLLMIGVGVVLLTVSAVAWRLTANESGTSCRAMLGFARNGNSRGDGGAEPNRRFDSRLAPSYGRPHHPYAAMMYPDFQFRPPPPSYQASMQEYRLRLLLLERSNPTIAAAAGLANPISSNMIPPPPAYRPYNGLRPGAILRHDVDCARPPSYRSRSSGGYSYQDNSPGIRPSLVPGIDHHHHSHMVASPLHSRDPSILSYLSQQSMMDNVSVVSGPEANGQGNSAAVVTVMQAVSVGMDLGMMSPMTYDTSTGVRCDGTEDGENKELPESNEDEGLVVVEGKKRGLNCEKSGLSKDGNLVRIVQTTDSSQVIGRNSVIVTVSGSNHSLWDQSLQNAVNNNTNSNVNNSHNPGGNPTATENNEVQILAHL